MRRIGLALAALLAALALVGAGCGGDDEATDDTTTTETTDTTDTDTRADHGRGRAQGQRRPRLRDQSHDRGRRRRETLEAGSYDLELEDLATDHNFHLTGPAVDVLTDVCEEGTQNVSVDLQPGTYTFVCDPHPTQMTGSFEVT